MSDLISRQAAIDAVHKEFDDCIVWDESGMTTADEVERILDGVPSAQPEKWDEEPCESCTGENNHFKAVQLKIIHCEDCKWWDKMKLNDKQGYCHAAKHTYYSASWEMMIYRTTSQSFSCADAERRKYETD